MFKKRRSIKLGKGVRLNVGKKGITSLSIGRKGLALNAGKKGVKATVNIRGTGLSARKYITKSKSNFKEPEERTSESSGSAIFWLILIAGIIWMVLR